MADSLSLPGIQSSRRRGSGGRPPWFRRRGRGRDCRGRAARRGGRSRPGRLRDGGARRRQRQLSRRRRRPWARRRRGGDGDGTEVSGGELGTPTSGGDSAIGGEEVGSSAGGGSSSSRHSSIPSRFRQMGAAAAGSAAPPSSRTLGTDPNQARDEADGEAVHPRCTSHQSPSTVRRHPAFRAVALCRSMLVDDTRSGADLLWAMRG